MVLPRRQDKRRGARPPGTPALSAFQQLFSLAGFHPRAGEVIPPLSAALIAKEIKSAKQGEEGDKLTAVQTTPGRRLGVLDAARGFVLLNMLAYHLLYDLVVLFGVRLDWFVSWQGYVWQQFIACSFIFLSGVSCRFSHSNARRGAALLGWGVALSVATRLVIPGQFIRFGVLHFLGCAALLWALMGRFLDRLPADFLFLASLLLFLFTNGTQWGYWGVWRVPVLELPDALYTTGWLFPLGFPGPDFYSADYFPLLPWLFLFWMGAAFHRLLEKAPRLLRRLSPTVPLLGALGRRTLVVYLLHQPVLYGFVWLWYQLFL